MLTQPGRQPPSKQRHGFPPIPPKPLPRPSRPNAEPPAFSLPPSSPAESAFGAAMKDRVRSTHISASCPAPAFNFGGRPVADLQPPGADDRYDHADSDDEGFSRNLKTRAMTMPSHSLTVLSLMQSFPGDPAIDTSHDDTLDLPPHRPPADMSKSGGENDNGDLQFSFSFS